MVCLPALMEAMKMNRFALDGIAPQDTQSVKITYSVFLGDPGIPLTIETHSAIRHPGDLSEDRRLSCSVIEGELTHRRPV